MKTKNQILHTISELNKEVKSLSKKPAIGMDEKKQKRVDIERKKAVAKIKFNKKVLLIFNSVENLDEDFLVAQIELANKQMAFLEREKYPYPDKLDKKGVIIDRTKSKRNDKAKQIEMLNYILND